MVETSPTTAGAATAPASRPSGSDVDRVKHPATTATSFRAPDLEKIHLLSAAMQNKRSK